MSLAIAKKLLSINLEFLKKKENEKITSGFWNLCGCRKEEKKLFRKMVYLLAQAEDCQYDFNEKLKFRAILLWPALVDWSRDFSLHSFGESIKHLAPAITKSVSCIQLCTWNAKKIF